ncbi:MAG: sensor histidine kinase [Clostridium sp.]|jgi:signal transduction histidine kinase|nr:sensor histidine kinase [Clostridium sp.]
MNFITFCRDKLFYAVAALLTAGFGGFVLWALHCPPVFIALTSFLYLSGGLSALLREYIIKKSYYRSLYASLDALEQKHYIADVLPPPSFSEGEILSDVLQAAVKSMNDEIAVHRKGNREYREYVELWVHEIKTPISGAKLVCENNGYAEVSAELAKVERYVEQALFYARSSAVEKDYVLREISLKELLHTLLRDNAKILIAHKIKVEAQAEGTVAGDPKWLGFILRQLLDNSVKYGAKTLRFTFGNHTLTVRDDGIGIPSGDLPRIFERGFTGENGRGAARSTGMGLYICKELCVKMGLEISARSEDGTAVSIVFPQNPYVTFL